MILNLALQIVLCAALTLVAYAYIGFPLLIWGAARLFGRIPVPPPVANEILPTVSILISALNEEEVIGERLKNALACEYPSDRCEIVIANLRKIIDLIANQSHCELQPQPKWLRRQPVERRTAKTTCSSEFIFEAAPPLRQHRRKVGFGSKTDLTA